MKRILLIFLLIGTALCGAPLPAGIDLSITLKGAKDNELTITPQGAVIFILNFTNHTDRPLRLRIHDYDPYHNKLPYPVDCAVRMTDKAGQLHAMAKDNGEWWSQFKCWSTLFLKDDPRNYRLIEPGAALSYEVALADILKVPAGGEPDDWPYDHRTGFKPGSYHGQLRYGSILSPLFSLRVNSGTK